MGKIILKFNQTGTCMRCMQALAFTLLVWAAGHSAPLSGSPSNVWYTQIGQWHLTVRDSASGGSFLFHDARVDGARSGQATANVRLNFVMNDIRRFDAGLALGQAPTMAGLLVQDKKVTYYFLIERNAISDSLLICRYSDNQMTFVSGARVTAADTVSLALAIVNDTIFLRAYGACLSLPSPSDFPRLATVGFECLQGSVSISHTGIIAQNAVINESFDKATLFNLHLDKLLSVGGK